MNDTQHPEESVFVWGEGADMVQVMADTHAAMQWAVTNPADTKMIRERS